MKMSNFNILKFCFTCTRYCEGIKLTILRMTTALTDKKRLVSELTRSDSWGLNTNWNSLCVYNVGRKARSSDCIDTVLSVFKFIINIGCLLIGQIHTQF